MEGPNPIIRDAEGNSDQLRARIRELEARQQEARMAAMGRMAGVIAHDLNNYLTPILAYGNMVSEDLPPDSPMREFMSEIVASGEKALSLTRALQALRVQPAPALPVDVAEAVQASVSRLKKEFPAEIKFMSSIDPAQGPVMAEGGNIDRILDELGRNAAQAMPCGGTVTFAARPVAAEAGDPTLAPGEYVLITVRDEGAGMAPELRGSVFDPFFTTREKGRGKGLGLSLAYAAAVRSKGVIRCTSEVGAGTEFLVYLPKAP